MQNLKKTFILTIACLVCFTLPTKSQSTPQAVENKLHLPTTEYTIAFKWQGDSVLNHWEKHSAILIPVKLTGCPKTFYMQFDLGSPYSLFYQKKLQTITIKYPKAKATINGTTATIDFSIGKTKIGAEKIVMRDFGNGNIDWNDNSPIIIGTLGVDLIDGKTMTLDYPKQKLTISPEAVTLLKSSTYTSFTYFRRSVILPAKVNGKQTMLFFDTGSSRYSLLTDQKTVLALATTNAPLFTSKVSSWDKVLTANSLSTTANIEISGQAIPIGYATYMEGVSSAQVEMMTKLGIGGMTGNKLFLSYKLILDTKNKKFALLK
ncbi:hypothetical protein EZ428_21380 [Pedobacter frigiditerrae]|uniref:Aspartyl protease n=1 Tax=Pedobacter frigiditerrae TaxID=2530452 RepID=A0A4R0MKV7_9SPHI|nr:hypothetical protein [Pedobacter frigiditerrae]TCC87260.1 hypothetical protein EZ428_21380 [Pedobacter frigiditerrae]